jgi:malate:Na+ symporter
MELNARGVPSERLCGQGGTGTVAIPTGTSRVQLMPFAQIASHIGEAITVTFTLSVLARIG